VEHPDISRRNILKSSALGVGAFGTLSVASAAAADAAPVPPAAAAAAAAAGMDDAFLKIDGIPGESTDTRHRDEIEVLSFAWGVTRKVSPTGAPMGKPDLQGMSFMTRLSKASPLLVLASAAGTRIPRAVLTVRQSRERPLDFLIITLETCVVGSYQTSGSVGGGELVDAFTLEFATVTISYAQQRPDGTLGTPVVVTYP